MRYILPMEGKRLSSPELHGYCNRNAAQGQFQPHIFIRSSAVTVRWIYTIRIKKGNPRNDNFTVQFRERGRDTGLSMTRLYCAEKYLVNSGSGISIAKKLRMTKIKTR